MSGWIGFDLDGTLARSPTDGSFHDIGEPIKPMVDLVKQYLSKGWEVRIMTARASGPFVDKDWKPVTEEQALEDIKVWCETHIGQRLPVTCKKDYQMITLYDDRAIQVEMNTGRIIG